MDKAIGKKTWLIPDMYWPEITSEGHYVSHESICVLNASKEDCDLEFTLYFENQEPMKGLVAKCPGERTHHVRMDAILNGNGENIPRGVPYAALVQASTEVVVQYTRLDTTQCENAIMTTMAYPV